MFVARSTPRIRRTRLVFVALGLAPTAALVAWAVHLRGEVHRAAVERRWQEAIGLPLTVERVEYPRPGVIRTHGCVLPAAGDRAAVELPLVEVESSADEDRVRIGRLGWDLGTAALAVDLARRWLDDPVRFRKACIIEVGDFNQTDSGRPEVGPAVATPLRVECVVLDGTRAVRIVRRGPTTDEVRIVRHPAADRSPVRHPRYRRSELVTSSTSAGTPSPSSISAAASTSGSTGPQAASTTAAGPAPGSRSR